VIPDTLSLASAWTAGTALASAGLGWGQVGGSGIRGLLVFVTAVGLAAMGLTGAALPAAIGAVGLVVVLVAIRRPRVGAMGWLITGFAALPEAIDPGWLMGTGTVVLLGSITAGLCLGHWFLVDPHLPRRPMRLLAGGALLGLAVTALATYLGPTSPPAIGDIAYTIAVVSGIITAVVLALIFWSLAVPTYKGVQSATGLFYVSTMSVSAFVIVTSALRAAAV